MGSQIDYRAMSFIALLFTVLLLSACSTIAVDESQVGFDEATFQIALNDCRGGNLIDASFKTLEISIIGAGLGAAEGASAGACCGDSAEGAAIGAALGGFIGLLKGAHDAISEHETSFTSCLEETAIGDALGNTSEGTFAPRRPSCP